MYRAIALDPGGTTGWATYTQEMKFDGVAHLMGEWTWGQIGPDEHHAELWQLLGHMQVQEYEIVCESFEYRNYKHRDNLNLMSKEYIGVAKLFAAEEGVKLAMQTAGLAKPFVTDEKLKALDLWFPGKQHARDAMRHLIYYLVNRKKMTYLVKPWRDL